ncbi:uncharacterized protein LOC108148026 [Drosophila elegans]|uniref:uncharacterized protein LOC108148026 n=1 Tax=Drosophila elegans TaxID=30023 RepID=UPI0007E5D6F6|nr:uncharacterized protein LOC108148026 [Drosophila elegans]XP_017130351.1 uncharacterized protein LOC108148026 [Drosophila elegans]XP_017130352.1 uncharacterized protein LOC108148026 [Drosophila elegans]XP_017130353.1 uncharacterized protein LOC108148026 [Drosophila elegans]XP_041566417.1 uncharacterized protein LOC108148026 [Drosophila elegans]
MPAAIVIVKQHKQRQQKEQQKHRKQREQDQRQQEGQQICNINLCGFSRRSGAADVDIIESRSPGHAADVDVPAAISPVATAATAVTASAETAATAATTTATTTATAATTRLATTTRAVIIIMALVVSIVQQQQPMEQQQQQSLLWPFYNGLGVAAAFTGHPDDSSDGPTLSTFLSSSPSPSAASTPNSTPSFAAANGPQTEATNHTFKSLAFLDASFGSDLFAQNEREKDEELDTDKDMDMDMDSSSQSLPIFDFGMPRNITGRTGHTEAIIKCRVDSLHDKSVSWIRKRDLHILTVGTATYTSDKRFQVSESKDSREWTLHVKSPLAKDSGIYECQVNTEPKMSMAFQLNIIEISPDAKAVISGPPDLHFKAGSAIILNCLVQQPSVKDIGPIYWYRGEHMITPFDADDGQPEIPAGRNKDSNGRIPEDPSLNDIMSEVDLRKEFATRIAMESQLGDTLKSRLRISNAQTTDTGNYTCQPTTASSASVLVHVINDENPAAMQKSGACPRALGPLQLFWLFWLLELLLRAVLTAGN